MKDIKFGMPSLIECNTIEENIVICKNLGLDFIELNMNLPCFQIENVDVEKCKQLAKDNNIFYTLHLPEELNPADFNPKIKKAYIKTVVDAIELAKILDIPILNMHMVLGVYFTMPDKKIYLFDEYKENYIQSIDHFRKQVEDQLGEGNITLCIENCGIYDKAFICDAVNGLLKSKYFALTWDIAHDFSSGNKDYSFIMTNKVRVRHMHVHDALGKSNHLPLGIGEIDLSDKFQLACQNGCRCVLETKTMAGLRKSVEYIRNNTR